MCRIAGGSGTVRRLSTLAVVACCLVGGLSIYAQSAKAAKEADKLSKAGQDAESAVKDVVDQVKSMLEGYNAIIDGKAKNVQSSYKKLSSDLKGTEKKLDSATKSVGAMDKQAQTFFSHWESDIGSINNEGLKEKSQKRLDASKQKYATLGEMLNQASTSFAPLLQNLNDQILFLGRDLSPGAIADLQDEAAALNQQAEQVFTTVEDLMAKAAQAEAPVEEATAD